MIVSRGWSTLSTVTLEMRAGWTTTMHQPNSHPWLGGVTVRRTSGKNREQDRHSKLQQKFPFSEHDKAANKMSLLLVRELTLHAKVTIACHCLGLEPQQSRATLLQDLAIHSVTLPIGQKIISKHQIKSSMAHKTKWTSIYWSIQATRDSTLEMGSSNRDVQLQEAGHPHATCKSVPLEPSSIKTRSNNIKMNIVSQEVGHKFQCWIENDDDEQNTSLFVMNSIRFPQTTIQT